MRTPDNARWFVEDNQHPECVGKHRGRALFKDIINMCLKSPGMSMTREQAIRRLLGILDDVPIDGFRDAEHGRWQVYERAT